MNKSIRRKSYLMWSVAILQCLPLSVYADATGTLSLASVPLISSTGPEPNVLVAVDDSTSMDMEMLFPTSGGRIYWDSGHQSATKPDGEYYDNGDNYDYIFPGGDHIRDYSFTHTIPLVSQLAYGVRPITTKPISTQRLLTRRG